MYIIYPDVPSIDSKIVKGLHYPSRSTRDDKAECQHAPRPCNWGSSIQRKYYLVMTNIANENCHL